MMIRFSRQSAGLVVPGPRPGVLAFARHDGWRVHTQGRP
jgi:hypothetical protein